MFTSFFFLLFLSYFYGLFSCVFSSIFVSFDFSVSFTHYSLVSTFSIFFLPFVLFNPFFLFILRTSLLLWFHFSLFTVLRLFFILLILSHSSIFHIFQLALYSLVLCIFKLYCMLLTVAFSRLFPFSQFFLSCLSLYFYLSPLCFLYVVSLQTFHLLIRRLYSSLFLPFYCHSAFSFEIPFFFLFSISLFPISPPLKIFLHTSQGAFWICNNKLSLFAIILTSCQI